MKYSTRILCSVIKSDFRKQKLFVVKTTMFLFKGIDQELC